MGSDALRVSTGAGEIVEEKVPLPTRWLKGFAETQMLSAGMACRHALTGSGPAPVRAGAAAVIVDQDRDVGDPGGPLAAAGHAGDARRGLRGGPERLRVLEPLLRYATALRAYGAETAAGALPQASAWVLSCPARGSRWV